MRTTKLTANQQTVLRDVAAGTPYGPSFDTDTRGRRIGRTKTLRSLRKAGMFEWCASNQGNVRLTDAGRAALTLP